MSTENGCTCVVLHCAHAVLRDRGLQEDLDAITLAHDVYAHNRMRPLLAVKREAVSNASRPCWDRAKLLEVIEVLMEELSGGHEP